MAKFNLDGHKLQYHPKQIYEFYSTGDTYPLYMEISPVGKCNHRCVFCAYDYIGYPNRSLDKNVLYNCLKEMQEKGLKSVLYAGEGEPLLHKDISEMIINTKNLGIDVGLFTNGELLTKKLNEEIFKSLTFIRFSVNAGDEDTYSKIHKKDVFNKIINNIKHCVFLKEKYKLNITIGMQFVLLPENIHTVENIVKIAAEIGVDYISIKPFNQQNEKQFYQLEKQFEYAKLEELFLKLESYSRKDFNVTARVNSFKNYYSRDYNHCYGCNFITVLNSAGELASCLPYWDKKDFIYGNINNNTFNEIWNSNNRATIKKYLENNINVHSCPPNCRPNAINSYLYELKHPKTAHINFI